MKLANDDYIDPKLRAKLRKKFSSMMSSLFKEEGASLRIEILSEPEVTSFIDTHSSVLNGAISKSKMSDKMRSRMEESNWIFSGMKTFHELNEAFPSMIDENGNKKPFERFLKDVQSIDERYNKQYLRAEYGFAEASAQMASKWERFAEDGDEYNLQYRTAGDDAVRPEHAALEGVTLPQSDRFWDIYWPLNGWNCRCTVVQVLKNKYPVTPREEAMRRGKEALAKDKKGMFKFNSGKEQRTFPAYNPYTTSKCKTCDLAKMKLAANVSDNELCEACYIVTEKAAEIKKSEAAKLREHYMKEMAPLLKKKVTVDGNGHPMSVGFSKKGNRHLYSDTFRRSSLKKEYLAKLDQLLQEAKFVRKAKLNKPRKDEIKRFYYYEIKLDGKKFYLNVAEEDFIDRYGKRGHNRYLYSITEKIRK